MSETLTQERLKELLDYDPASGVWTWKVRRQGARIGRAAGCNDSSKRTWYRRIKIDGKIYAAHRLAYLWMTGSWPPKGMDVAHDDQNGLHNWWSNLKPMSNRENAENQRRPKNNRSGTIGVCRDGRVKKWRAQIWHQGKSIHLGHFTDKVDAIAARKAAEKRLGFHRLHGSG